MKKILLLLTFLLIITGCSNVEEELRNQIKSEQQINSELKSNIVFLENSIMDKNDEINGLKIQFKTLSNQYSKLQEKCDVFNVREEKTENGGIFDQVFK